MDAMILQQDGLPHYLSKHLIRYVDYQNGNDGAAATRGLGPGYAYKTIQAAYNELVTTAGSFLSDGGKGLGVGRIILLPQSHDIGSGVALTNTKPVEIVGFRAGSVTHFPSLSASVIVSSGNPASFISVTSGSKGYGFVFRDLAFRVNHTTNTSTTKVIYASEVGDLVVDHCSFDTDDNTTNITCSAVYHEDLPSSAGEAGWVRVIDNNVSRMQLYKAATTTGAQGGNFNRGRIRDNVIFYGGTLPMIEFSANVGSYLVDGNNLEGTAVGVQIGGNGAYLQNTFINNAGEDDSSGTPPNAFYNLSGAVSQQLIIGGYCLTPSASGAGTFVNFGANAYRNHVIGVFDRTAVTTGYKRYVSETSNSDKNYLVPLNMVTPTYTLTNGATARTFDPTTATAQQVANTLSSLISDLQARGVFK
jgi:hypothetical protein